IESTALTNDDTDVTTTGNLAVNGGDITSTGTLTVTPGGGTNLNVALSGAGDFVVNTDDLVVDTSEGNVGIGTASPTNKLEVVDTDTTASRAGLSVAQSGAIVGTGYGLYATKTGASNTNVGGYFSATGATNNYGLIVENGDVGIGTTGPSDLLHIAGGQLRIDNNTDPTNKGCFRYNGTSNELEYSNDCSSFQGFASSTGGGWTDDGTVVRLTTITDSVGIGTAAPGAGAKLSVAGRIYQTNLGNSTFIGDDAGRNDDLTTNLNVALGYKAGFTNITGNNNVYIGYRAGYLSTNTWNTFIGSEAGFNNTDGSNTFVGYRAGYVGSTGSWNSFFGHSAGRNNTANNNVFIGYQAGQSNTSGSDNTYVGAQSGVANLTGTWNTYLGYRTGYQATGSSNTFVGYQAGYWGTQAGGFNSFFGRLAGRNNTGDSNVFIGYQAGQNNTSGSDNTFIGNSAGIANLTGGWNTYIGYQAGQNATGGSNTFVGYQTGYWGTSVGGFNSFFGRLAGRNNTASNNSFFGYQAGYGNTSGSSNAYFGYEAGRANSTSGGNSYFGFQAGEDNTGASNTFVGYQAGDASSAGSSNSFLGYGAGGLNTGSSNVYLGYQAGNNGTTGSNNIVLGYDIDVPSATGNEQLNIGNLIFGTGIDGTGTTISTGNIGIGTISPAYDLDVNGDIRAIGSVYYGGTIGNPDGTPYTKPDFVFEEGYEVMSVEQVEEYLRVENHLPWMTSVKQEKEENGDVIDMTRMAFETAETAENLQLQIIGLNKMAGTQQEQISLLQSGIGEIETDVEQSALAISNLGDVLSNQQTQAESMGDLSELLAAQQTQIDNLVSSEQNSEIKESLNKLTSRMDNLEAKLLKVDSTADDSDADPPSQTDVEEKQVESADPSEQNNEFKTQLDKLVARMDELEAQVANDPAADDTKDYQSQIDAQQKQIDDLKAQNNSLKEQIDSIKRSLEAK
ncbi:hypothetical protein LCGC14_1271010, partial [marine sediment metagenome]